MRKLNPKHLAVALAILTLTWIAFRFVFAPRKMSNIERELLAVDTAKIDELRILSSGREKTVVLKRLDVGRWKVGEEGEEAYEADQASVKQALGLLHRMEATRMLTRKKEKWNDYQVGDSTLHIMAYAAGKRIVSLRIGKQIFPSIGNAVTAVRVGDGNDVYAVEGYLNFTFDKSVDNWRDKTFMRLKAEMVDRIVFEYPADSSFTLIRKDSLWYLGDAIADTDKVTRYLGQFRNKNLSSFYKDVLETTHPAYQVRFEGKGAELEKVLIWKISDQLHVLKGIHLPVLFTDAGSTIVKDLLKPKTYFLKN
jgi:hypothetical protein